MKTVKDFITRDLTSVNEEVDLKELVEILSWRSLSGIPVVNQENEVVGYISEKDIITSIFPEQVKIESSDVIGLANLSQIVKKLGQAGGAKVKDYMAKNIICVNEDTPALEVAEIMLHKDILRLPVVREKKLIGIIDRASLAKILLEEPL